MRFSVFLFFFLLSNIISKGQHKSFDLGLSLSPSVEGFYNPAYKTNSLEFREKLSYNFGLKTKFFLSRRVCLSSGVMIFNKGRTYTVPLSSVSNQTYNFATLSNSIWYLSIPFNIQTYFSLPNGSSLGSNIGFLYGRKVFQYLHQVRRNYNFYTFDKNGASQNYFGVNLGLSYLISVNNKVIEISPIYVRQLNSGWQWKPESYPNSRFDSYVLEFVFYGLLKKDGLVRW